MTEIFAEFEKVVRSCGPVIVIPQKTRVVFMVRVRFASALPRKSHLLINLEMSERRQHPLLERIEQYNRHFIGHIFRLCKIEDLDDGLRKLICESYGTGKQAYLLRERSSTG